MFLLLDRFKNGKFWEGNTRAIFTKVQKIQEFGIFFIDDSVNKKLEKRIYDKMEELQRKANKEFEEYLNQHGLESVMGVVVKKGTVK